MVRRKNKSKNKSRATAAAPAAASGGGAGGEASVLDAPVLEAPAAPAWTPRVVTLPLPRGDCHPSSAFERTLALPLGRLSPLFSCLTLSEARPLRTLSRAAEAHIAATPFNDMDTPVTDLCKWRVCFPAATAVQLSPTTRWTRAALPFLAGVTALNLSGITDPVSLEALRPLLASLTLANFDGCPVPFAFETAKHCGVTTPVGEAALAAVTKENKVIIRDEEVPSFVEKLVPGLPVQLLRTGFALLTTRAQKAPIAAAIVAAGGIDRAISALRAYKSDEHVMKYAAALLMRLQLTPSHARVVAQTGPTPALLAVCEAHPGVCDVVKPTCWLLGALPKHTPSAINVMMASGSPRILLSAIQGCASDAAAVHAAAAVLQQLLEHSKSRASAAILAVPGALTTLLSALEANASQHKTALVVMHILQTLGEVADVGAALRAGGVGALAAVARAHPTDELAMGLACGLLFFAVEPLMSGRAMDVRPLNAAGALDVPLAALKAVPALSQIVYAVLGLLLFGAEDQMRTLLTSYPVVSTIVTALASSPALAAQGLPLLGVAADKVRDVTGPQLAEPAVTEALSSSLLRGKGKVVLDTLSLLRAAAEADGAAVAAAAGGALVATLASASVVCDPATATAALEVLGICAHAPGSAASDALVAAGAPRVVVAALQRALPAAAMLNGALVLWSLAGRKPSVVAAVGGASALLQLARAHRDVPNLLAMAAGAAAALADGAPEALAAHVAETAEVAGAALQTAVCGDFETCFAGFVLLRALLKSGADAGALAGALVRLRCEVEAAADAAASVSAEEESGAGREVAETAAKVTAIAAEVGAAVSTFKADHPELAAQLEGW